VNAASDDILNFAQPHQVAYCPSAPTTFDRPPVAPDPVQGVTLLKPSDPAYDCTPATPHSEMCHDHSPDNAVQPITTAHNDIRFGNSSFYSVLTYVPHPVVPYYAPSAMTPCLYHLGEETLTQACQHLLQPFDGETKKTYPPNTNQDGLQTGIQIFGDLALKSIKSDHQQAYKSLVTLL